MFEVEQNEDAINDVLNTCAEAEEAGTSKARGMSYEQGIKAGIEWLTNKTYPHPLAD